MEESDAADANEVSHNSELRPASSRPSLIKIIARKITSTLDRDREPYSTPLRCAEMDVQIRLGCCKARKPIPVVIARDLRLPDQKVCIIIKLLTIFVNDFVVPDEAAWRAYARSVHDPKVMCRLDRSTLRPMAPHGGTYPARGKEGRKSDQGRSAEPSPSISTAADTVLQDCPRLLDGGF
jgi:hypothetical protein